MSYLYRIITLVSCILLFSWNVRSSSFSYVYIQGDKQIPFYVKLEDEMLPRYSKNYCIIPQLAPGPIRIQILFQQNEFPPQTFMIQVPDNGYRGFLLTRKDNAFALYDIQQRFYLLPGDAGEDHLPEMITTPIAPSPAKNSARLTNPAKENSNNIQDPPFDPVSNPNEPQFIADIELDNTHSVSNVVAAPATETNDIPPSENTSENNNPTQQELLTRQAEEAYYKRKAQGENENNPEITEPATITALPQTDDSTRQAEEAYYRRQAEINAPQEPVNQMPAAAITPPANASQEELTRQAEAVYYQRQRDEEQVNIANEPAIEEQQVAQDAYTQPEETSPKLETPSPPIYNSDCPNPVDDHKFGDIFSATRDKKDDDRRITYLMKLSGDGCYTTRQAFLLARQLQAESMRYSFLKKVYPHIVDQQNFPTLEEALFKTLEWKSYFRLIYKP